ncbi:carbohydrate ABC transporter substrate-binding protein [Mediterraneibacter sp. NSJ-55]|uniref:Carbohydrate ABC transporter substrate-binding protein n=1 Tax=Mediterraneibacter hominis TaxID=2763054 RepID=A0A923RRG1_9FIRM|nr:ABC transporter substrate-binding protein [Mediterraneibacter hominis]MBC5690599.1 carbohydrate ABC transporter substrate-binding protein [Mediterraneibacter hominis]
MKKRASKIIAMIMAASMLAGCGAGASGDSGKSEDGKVTIEFMHDEAEEDRMAVYDEIIKDFMAENPDIEVKQTAISEDGFEDKVKTLISAGEMPAIVAGSTSLMQLLDGEEMINTKANKEVVEERGRDDFYEQVLSLLNAQDGEGMIGVPISTWVNGIWYRKDLFAEKGLNPPETWEDILTAAKTFHDPDNKMYGIMFGTEEGAIAQNNFELFAGSNGAQLFDEEGNVQFTSPEMKETMEFYKELYQYSLPGSNGTTQIRDAMVGGNTAMCVYSSYILAPLYNAEMGEKIGYCVPENTQKSVYSSPSIYTISNTISDEETEAAKKFISYMLTDEVNIKVLHIAPGGPQPVMKSVAENPEYRDADVLQVYGEEIDKIADALNYINVFGTQDGITDSHIGAISNSMIISKAINQILVQDQDMDEMMQIAQEDMEKEISR